MFRAVWIMTLTAYAALAAPIGATSAQAQAVAQEQGVSQQQGVVAAPAAPRENLMKACGDKWRGVREAESANGVTWPQFLARCRGEAAAAPGSGAQAQGQAQAQAQAQAQVRAPAQTTSVPRSSASQEPSRPRATESAAPRTAMAPVFPQDVSQRHASERPALARQRTCADQFKANKVAQANGGLRWIEQGGGYWSRCNAHLKQTRA